eukprot:scaffold10115_cov66-Phaeocystis_antarctica.AAC.1
MANKRCHLPTGRTQHKGYEEVHVPALKATRPSRTTGSSSPSPRSPSGPSRPSAAPSRSTACSRVRD